MAEVAKSTLRAAVEKCMILYRSAMSVLVGRMARLDLQEMYLYLAEKSASSRHGEA